MKYDINATWAVVAGIVIGMAMRVSRLELGLFCDV